MDGDAILGTCNRARNAHTLRVLGLFLWDPGPMNVTISRQNIDFVTSKCL